jgi:hypothetical protein
MMASEIEAIARAWMAHQGYTDDEVNAVSNNHDSYGCEVEGMVWNCHDENGNSNHPVWDALCVACEMANVAVEALQSIGYLCTDDDCRDPHHYELRA